MPTASNSWRRATQIPSAPESRRVAEEDFPKAHQQGRAAGHEHLSAETRRFAGQFPFESDEPTQHDGQGDLAENVQLHTPVYKRSLLCVEAHALASPAIGRRTSENSRG
jgi:hypothetical protein